MLTCLEFIPDIAFFFFISFILNFNVELWKRFINLTNYYAGEIFNPEIAICSFF